jgi:hypothetical protein
VKRPAVKRIVAAIGLSGALLGSAGVPIAAADTGIDVTMSRSANPTSGSAFTFTPHYSNGFVPPDAAICAWELRWGDHTSLYDNVYNQSFGSVAIRGAARDGFCGPWTFTLPYSAGAEWLYNFGIGVAGYYFDTMSFIPGPGFPTFHGTNGAPAGSGITTSNLPGVWLSMPNGTLIGDQVTATAHPFGGYVMPASGAFWDAYSVTCNCRDFARLDFSHSLTWTFTASVPGTIAVFYNDKGEMDGTNFAGAGIDPRVKAVRRVTMSASPSVHLGSATHVSGRAWLFHGPVTYVWTLDGTRIHVGASWTMRFWVVGRHTLTLVATDGYGHRATRSQVVTVVPWRVRATPG